MEQVLFVPADGTSQGDLSAPNSAKISLETNPSELTNPTDQQLVSERIARASQALLASNSPSERAAAARELGLLGNQSAVNYLLAALYDPSPEVCLAAAESLGRLGDSSSLGPLTTFRQRHSNSGAQPIIDEAIAAITGQNTPRENRSSESARHVEPLPVLLDDLNDLNDAYTQSFGEFDNSSNSTSVEEFPSIESSIEVPANSEFSDDEEFQVEQAAIRKAEHELACRRAEAEARKRTKEENARLARLEAIRLKAREEGDERAEQEQQLQSELDEIRRTQTQQLKRIEEAEAARALQEESLRIFEADALRCAEECKRRIEKLEARKQVAELEVSRHLEREHQLKTEIKEAELRKLEHQSRLGESSEQLSLKQQALSDLEAQVQQNDDSTEQLSENIEKLRKEETRQRATIAEIQLSLSHLETLRSQTENECRGLQASLQQLNTQIEDLDRARTEQLAKIAEVEARVREKQTEANQLADQEARLSVEAVALRESIANSSRTAEALRLQTKADLQRQADEQEQHLAELQSILEAAQSAATERTARHQSTVTEIETLREAELRDLQLLEETEARRIEQEQKADKVELEWRRQSEAEQDRIANLECQRTQHLEQLEKYDEVEKLLAFEVEELRIVEAVQVQRISGVQFQIQESKRNVAKIAEREDRLREEFESLSETEKSLLKGLAEAKQRTLRFEEQARQTAVEEQEQVATLQQLQVAAQRESEGRKFLQAQLNSELENLRQSSSTQESQLLVLQKEKSELEISVGQKAEAETSLTQEIDALRTESVNHRKSIEEKQRELEAEQLNAHGETERLKELQAALQIAHEAARQRSESETQLKTELAAFSQSEVEQVARLADAVAQVQQQKEAEQRRLSELERVINATKIESQQRSELEQQLKAEIDSLREAEAKQVKRIAGVAHEVQQRKEQETKLTTNLEKLRDEETRQQKQINEATELIQQLKSESKRRFEEVVNVREELANLQELEASDRQRIAEDQRQLVEAERVRRVQEEERRVAELESLRKSAEAAVREVSENAALVESQVQKLNVLEVEQLQRLALAQSQLEQSQVESRRLKDEHSSVHLETIEQQAFANLGASETDRQRHDEIEQLKQEEADKSDRIETVGAQLREIQDNSKQKNEATELQLQALVQMAEIETRARVEATERVSELEAKLREFEVKTSEPEVEFEHFHSNVHLEAQHDSEVEINDSFEFSEPTVQNQAVDGPESDDHDSFIILDFDQADEFEVVKEQVEGEPESVSLVPEEFSANEFESNSQSIEVVREEKGIELVSEGGSIPAVVLERLRSEDPVERGSALFDLTQFADDESFSLITKAFDDPVADVRHAAARALFELDRDRAASFTRALREASVERRRRIGSAMGACGIAADAINHLIGESREKTYDAFSILFLMAKAGEIQPLVRSIETHSDQNVKLAVISLLTFSNQPETIPAFRRLAVRATLPSEIRSALMEAIHQISSQNRQAIQSAA